MCFSNFLLRLKGIGETVIYGFVGFEVVKFLFLKEMKTHICHRMLFIEDQLVKIVENANRSSDKGIFVLVKKSGPFHNYSR